MLTSGQSLEIQVWPIDRLVYYVRNPRKNDSAVDRMVASIREFGFKVPVLARSDGEVVDGHLRLKAAKKLQITEIPLILCDEWTAAQVKAFRLMVNRSVAPESGEKTDIGCEFRADLAGLPLHIFVATLTSLLVMLRSACVDRLEM